MCPSILVLSWPTKKDTVPLSPRSYCRIKDGPYLLPRSAPGGQNLPQLAPLTKVFPAQTPSGGALIRTPQDAHHLPKQTQKTTAWCSTEWVNGTKTDGGKLTNQLEEVQRK